MPDVAVQTADGHDGAARSDYKGKVVLSTSGRAGAFRARHRFLRST